MLLKINETKVNFIGDPHFGRPFNHVPLHRKGEREKMQMDTFMNELYRDCDFNIIVGDLFDTFTVSHELIYSVYNSIRSAANDSPNKVFIIYAGNHDKSRDESLTSSFDVLKEMLAHVENVYCFTDSTRMTFSKLKLLVLPYSEFNTAAEEASKFEGQEFDLVVGHWDVDTVGGEHNLRPTELLSRMTKTVVSGHVHTKGWSDYNGTQFYITGSMMPYSHGEDPEQTMYVTRTVEQIEMALAADPEAFKNNCLRVVMARGETPPVNVNCLQFTIKYVDDVEKEKQEVVVESFSFKKLFDETFKENEVPDDLRDLYWEKYRERANDDQQS